MKGPAHPLPRRRYCAMLHSMERRGTRWLPEGYVLERGEPRTLILRRPDGSFIAAFDAGSVAPEEIEKAVNEALSGRRPDHGGRAGAEPREGP